MKWNEMPVFEATPEQILDAAREDRVIVAGLRGYQDLNVLSRVRLLNDEPIGWREIETAPKNKAIIIFGNKGVGEGCFVDYPNLQGWYYADDRDPMLTEPTHWMPLPEPPTNG